jgi:hypothetical protein
MHVHYEQQCLLEMQARSASCNCPITTVAQANNESLHQQQRMCTNHRGKSGILLAQCTVVFAAECNVNNNCLYLLSCIFPTSVQLHAGSNHSDQLSCLGGPQGPERAAH